ncbi:LysR family transcriptional regulator [Paraburkholderia sediminicola]|uniref:LysR family transcriptional regulator n=1 Tax=Paraburkholderia TaxID=1822464 RepID=UPI0038B989BE
MRSAVDPIERFFQAGLKLSHLRLLTLFDSLGQIRLVAEKLNVTQPAISKQLAELEAGLGVSVMTRVGNRLQLTAVGETLTRRAREVFHQLEQARYEVWTRSLAAFPARFQWVRSPPYCLCSRPS